MPRALRIHAPGAFYHVTLRGNHRQNIFFSPADRRLLDDLTRDVLDRFLARVHAYCWMTNHIHLLIQVADIPLGRIMLRIASQYARAAQKRLHTTGHLFEKRYHAVLVDADAYLLELIRYIHLNPVRAHMVRHPRDYAWSSHRCYIGAADQPWVTTDFALRMFHAERRHAITAYERFIDANFNASSPLLECNAGDRRLLGSDDFAARVLGEAWRPRSPKSLVDLINEACAKFSVSAAALDSRSSERRLTYARAWIAHQALAARICSLAAVARRFDRTEGALRQSVKVHFNDP